MLENPIKSDEITKQNNPYLINLSNGNEVKYDRPIWIEKKKNDLGNEVMYNNGFLLRKRIINRKLTFTENERIKCTLCHQVIHLNQCLFGSKSNCKEILCILCEKKQFVLYIIINISLIRKEI